MLFYRRSREPSFVPMHVARVRYLSMLALASYPVGALMLLIDADRSSWLEFAGYGLIFMALAAFAGIVSTGVQRITAEQKEHLDPLELELRHKAYAMAFHIFASLVAASGLYAILALDTADKLGLWMPSTSDHWSGLLWAVLLTAMVLPTACLSWHMPPDTDEDV